MHNAAVAVPNRTPLVALLWASAISLTGSRLTLVAVPWFVLQTTGSAARTGITGAAEALAYIVAAFFGGALVDRFGFRRTSICADTASGVTVAMVPLLYHTVGLAFWELLVLVFLSTFFNTPGSTARQSLTPDLATLAAMPLERANTAVQMIRTFAQLAGPTLAGLLIAVIGTSDVLWLDAATFGVSAVIIAMAVPTSPNETAHRMANSGIRRYVDDLREGMRFLRHDRLIVSLAIGSACGNFLAAALFTVILPVYARASFGTAVGLGLMLSAVGGGALLGTLFYGAIGLRCSRRAVYIGSFLLSGIPRWILVSATPLPFALVALTLVGIGSGMGSPLILTIYQERIPAALRGRVIGTIIALNTIADPLALFFTGFLLDGVGLACTIAAVNAIASLVLVWIILNPVFRTMNRLNARQTPNPV
ncbi:MAG: MFS transporter [Chloroflexota bacterium]|nr:MFS transporter [Chloroflexota bacterium]